MVMKHFLLAFAFLPFCLAAQRDTANQRPRSGYNNSPEDSTQTTHKKLLKVVSLSVYLGGDFYRDGFEDRTILQQAAPQ